MSMGVYTLDKNDSKILIIGNKNKNKFLSFGKHHSEEYKGILYNNWNLSATYDGSLKGEKWFKKVNEKNIIIKNIKHTEINIVELFEKMNYWEMKFHTHRISSKFLDDLYTLIQNYNLVSDKHPNKYPNKNKKCLLFPSYRKKYHGLKETSGITIITHNGNMFSTRLSKHFLDKFIFKKSDIKLKIK